MTKYIENLNAYLSEMKIKQAFVCLKSGIDKNKLSRILTGVQEATVSDIEKIAHSLGKDAEYFMSADFSVKRVEPEMGTEIVFYTGNPSKGQTEFAPKLIELIENADEVLGAKGRYMINIEG